MSNNSLNNAFLAILAFVVVLLVFPILGNMPLQAEESQMLGLIRSVRVSGIDDVMQECYGGVAYGMYCYIARLLINLDLFSPVYALRLPGACITLILTLSLYSFVRGFDRASAAFLASLMFFACGWVMSFTFITTPALLPAAVLIGALVAQYKWIVNRTRASYAVMCLAMGLIVVVIGMGVLLFTSLVGCIYVILQLRRTKTVAQFLAKYLLAIPVSLAVAFVAEYFAVGDIDVVHGMLGIDQLAERFVVGKANGFGTFISFALFSIFPLSVPLALSAFWVARHPKRFLVSFHSQPWITRYGIIISVVALPTLFFAESTTVIFLYATIFFNILLISRYLMMQFNSNAVVWRVSGASCAFIILLALPCVYFYFNPKFTAWAITLCVLIIMNIYYLWKNKRDISENHRYLYNLITLYLLASSLFYGYIRPLI